MHARFETTPQFHWLEESGLFGFCRQCLRMKRKKHLATRDSEVSGESAGHSKVPRIALPVQLRREMIRLHLKVMATVNSSKCSRRPSPDVNATKVSGRFWPGDCFSALGVFVAAGRNASLSSCSRQEQGARQPRSLSIRCCLKLPGSRADGLVFQPDTPIQ